MTYIESEFVELKSMVVSDICKEVIAFANTKGGTIYIGIADNGTIIGVENPDQVILQLNNKIRDSIKPDITMFVRYETQTINDEQIIVVTIQKGTDRPYYLANKGLKTGEVFVRNGISSDPASDIAIRKMIKETDGDSFESMRSLEQSLAFEVASAQFSKRKISFDFAKMQTLGLVSFDGVYSNAGMLLSDQCNSTIKAATFSGIDKSVFQDRREFSGSLFKQMDDLYAYLDLRNQTKATFEGLYRIDTRDYPEEALLNCLIHRDYSFSAGTFINIYDDRVEFITIGGLPDNIELEDIMLGLSVCRNPKIASVFYRLKLIEAYGIGIPKIMNSYKQFNVKPKIEVTNNAFKITLPNCNFTQPTKNTQNTEYSYETQIIEFIKEHGQAIRSDIEALLKISQSTTNRILRRMIEEGYIYSEGKGKNIRYKAKK